MRPMESPLTTQEIAELIRANTESTFLTMLGLPLSALPERSEPAMAPNDGGVIALVGFAGEWSGTGAVRCGALLACTISSQMLMAEYPSVNDEVLDVMGEVANMIIGNFKDDVAYKLGPLGLSIPTVIYGKNFQARNASGLSWTVVPFDCQGELFEVKISIVRNRPLRSISQSVDVTVGASDPA